MRLAPRPAGVSQAICWNLAQPWGVEVQLPDGFDIIVLAGPAKFLQDREELDSLGVAHRDRGAGGSRACVLCCLPAGAGGRGFSDELIPISDVIRAITRPDAYVIGGRTFG